MKQVPLAKLEDKIIRPGFERHLRPLLMYRGNVTLGRAHRMWNLVVSGMEHEAGLSDLTQRLQLNPELSQLCMPERKKEALAIRSFLSRLQLNSPVMAEMPHLSEYVWWLNPSGPFGLTPVSEFSPRSRNLGAGGWRTFRAPQRPRRPGSNLRDVRPQLVYPFLIHDGGKPEHDLLRRVNAAVPRHFDPNTRADICQDIMVGILCGDFDPDNLTLPAKEMTKRVMKMFPTKYGPLSLDAEMPGTDGFRLIDTISEDDSIWERI